MKKILTAVALGLAAAAFAEGENPYVSSANIHAMVKVNSSLTNTIIAVPWTFYTPDGQSTTNLPVDRLVRPTNLTNGDLVMVLVNNEVYATWQLVDTDPAEVVDGYTCRHWVQTTTVQRKEDGDAARTDIFDAEHQDDSIQRGLGLWLYRQKPLNDDGTGKDFYLYGQLSTSNAVVEIAGGSKDTPTFTMLASPFPGQTVNLNGSDPTGNTFSNGIAWDWDNIGPDDTIVIVNDLSQQMLCVRRSLAKGGRENFWSYAKKVPNGRAMKTEYIYDLPFNPHTGFWYVRRTAGKYTFTWTKPAAE